MENKKMVHSRSCAPDLGTCQPSHAITKERPNQQAIRIIHIFAPKVIKTDAANFRQLVQQVTGKPAGKKMRRPPRETKLVGSPKSREFRLEAPLPTMKEDGERWEAPGSSFFSDFDRLIAGLMHNGDSPSSSSDMGDFPLIPMGSSHHDLLVAETHMS
ncbi:hypothetical protein AMTRI_Chr03g44290 [Amborella trichopoda]